MSTRRIKATLWRKTEAGPDDTTRRKPVWTRYYAWMDTAVPRATVLALYDGQKGDVVEFESTELGFILGHLKVTGSSRIELTYSPLVKSSPSLLKLMSGDVGQSPVEG